MRKFSIIISTLSLLAFSAGSQALSTEYKANSEHKQWSTENTPIAIRGGKRYPPSLRGGKRYPPSLIEVKTYTP